MRLPPAPNITQNERDWLIWAGGVGTVISLASFALNSYYHLKQKVQHPKTSTINAWPIPTGLPPIRTVQFQPTAPQTYAVIAIFQNGSQQRIGTLRNTPAPTTTS